MAYARWSDSDWYVYWLAGTDDTLCVHPLALKSYYLKYEQLKGIDLAGLEILVPGADEELLDYVQEFCSDVEAALDDKAKVEADAERLRE